MVEITVRLSQELNSLLKKITEEERIDVSEVFKRAIQVYAILAQYAKENKTLVAFNSFTGQIQEEIQAPEDTEETFDSHTIKLHVSETIYEGMRNRADELGVAPTDIVRKGLRVYQQIRELQNNGNNIGVIEGPSRLTLIIPGVVRDLGE